MCKMRIERWPFVRLGWIREPFCWVIGHDVATTPVSPSDEYCGTYCLRCGAHWSNAQTERSSPPKDGTFINVRLEDGQEFLVRYDPKPGAFGESIWRVDECTWLTPWSIIEKWWPAAEPARKDRREVSTRAARYASAVQSLSNSIARGTQHFDRDHTKELFNDCTCGPTIDPECTLHKNFTGLQGGVKKGKPETEGQRNAEEKEQP